MEIFKRGDVVDWADPDKARKMEALGEGPFSVEAAFETPRKESAYHPQLLVVAKETEEGTLVYNPLRGEWMDKAADLRRDGVGRISGYYFRRVPPQTLQESA